MSGTEPFRLNEDGTPRMRGPHFGRDIVPPRTDNDRDPGRARLRDSTEHVREHGATRDPVQDLGRGGVHPRALASRQDDC